MTDNMSHASLIAALDAAPAGDLLAWRAARVIAAQDKTIALLTLQSAGGQRMVDEAREILEASGKRIAAADKTIAALRELAAEQATAQDKIIAALREALQSLLAELLFNLRRRVTDQRELARIDTLIELARAALTPKFADETPETEGA
jgi:hypothetical protein